MSDVSPDRYRARAMSYYKVRTEEPAVPSLYQRGLQAHAARHQRAAPVTAASVTSASPSLHQRGLQARAARYDRESHARAAKSGLVATRPDPATSGERSWWTPTKAALAALAVTWVGIELYRNSQHTKRSTRVLHGFDSEFTIASSLERRGAEVMVSPGSRGPIDILAAWRSRRWAIQAKASIAGEPRWPGPTNAIGSSRPAVC